MRQRKSFFENFTEDKVGKHIFSILFAFLYITIVLLAVGLSPGVEDYIEAEREYEKLRQYAPDDTRLFSINSDYAGWIRINGTHIDYPMVQANNTKYLNTTFKGKENSAGAIFIDSHNTEQFEETLVIIHGSNTGTDSMFGSLSNFSDSSYLQRHQNLAILLPFGEIYMYQIFAAFSTTLDNKLFTLFDAEDDYIINFFTSIGAPESSTHFIVLSTPTVTGSNDRTVVFAAR